MSKDPAFLFYYQDFLVGTAFMSDREVGKYIRILCHLADKGRLSVDEMHSLSEGGLSGKLKTKFSQDKDGFFYQKRLKVEVDKRKKYAKSRRDNRLGRKHMKNISESYVEHMENENENEIKDKRYIFKPPSLKEVQAYQKEINGKTNPDSFIDFYASKGWMVGRNKMKDWKAAYRRACREWNKEETKATNSRGLKEYKHFDEVKR